MHVPAHGQQFRDVLGSQTLVEAFAGVELKL